MTGSRFYKTLNFPRTASLPTPPHIASPQSLLILMTITRQPYTEDRRKLVLAFDIGTTYSGVSYALLDPGLVPEIKSVGR